MKHGPWAYSLALGIATKAHDGQTRWDGSDYINHPISVAYSLDTWEEKVVGILHDVVEDTDVTLEELEVDFAVNIITALDALTHRLDELYCDYIKRVSRNELATKVKIADLNHNLSDLKPGQRKDKYELAKLYLEKL